MEPLLPKLEEARDNLLLGEVAALLHNIMKLTDAFISYQLNGQPAFNTFQVAPLDADFIHISDQAKEDLRDEAKERVWKYLSSDQREALSAQRLKFSLFPTDSYLLIELLSLWGLRRLNKGGIFQQKPDTLLGRLGFPLWLLSQCHGIAHVDKKEERKQLQAKQTEVRSSNAFGIESRAVGTSDFSLTQQLIGLDFSGLTEAGKEMSRVRTELVAKKLQPLAYGLADTQCPINEVTLWDWSWNVAALYKAALAQLVLENKQIGVVARTSLRWRTLRVSVDVLSVLAKAYRLPDLVGYDDAIQKGFDRVRHLIEVTYALGNQIYRDSTGIYFTFPGVCTHLSAQLLQELRWKIHDSMTGGQYEELAPSIDVSRSWGEHGDEQWRDAPRMLADSVQVSKASFLQGESASTIQWNSLPSHHPQQEVCPMCGIRFYGKKRHSPFRQQGCETCLARMQNARKNVEPGSTIWLDEIADEHDRVALVVGRFHLDAWLDGSMISTLLGSTPDKGAEKKQPSPARIMRVWRTTEAFWKECVSKLIASHFEEQRQADVQRKPDEQRHRFHRWLLHIPDLVTVGDETVLDGTIAGMPISLEPQGNGNYLTISNLELCKGSVKAGAQVRMRAGNGSGAIQGEPQLPERFATYYPTRTILTAPDQFLALVPGADALDLARQIADRYAHEMGKVRSRLPLDLAIVYFHRKMPLYAVMDAARRFLAEKPHVEEKWVVGAEHRKGETAISFTNGITWDIPTTFADGSPDEFYPYVGLCNSEEQGEYRANGRGYVHVARLEAGQEIAIAPSRFSYLWLDASARRYAVGLPDAEAPFTTQGMHLEEIAQLTKMWSKLKDAKITDTQLHATVQLLMDKRMAWKGNDAFQTFAAAVLDRTGLSKACITPTDVTSGPFFRCYDLHRRIMKQKLSDSTKPQAFKEAARA